MMLHHAYIALGSNLGNRVEHVRFAITRLRAHPAITITAVATPREYPALTRTPGESQPAYLNTCLACTTSLAPHALLTTCLDIEIAAGRIRTPGAAWQPRTLDLDLLLYDDLTLDLPTLTLPHPLMHTRRFVLEPLCEIAPTLVHPTLHRSMQSLLQTLE